MSGEAKENMMALSTLVEYVRKQVRIIIIGQCRVLATSYLQVSHLDMISSHDLLEDGSITWLPLTTSDHK